MDDGQHDRHFDEHADDSGQRRPRLEAKQGDGGRNGTDELRLGAEEVPPKEGEDADQDDRRNEDFRVDSQPLSRVSGLNCIMPKGTVAPGKV